MATVNEAEVKFVADLSNFTAGASQAAGELKSKLIPAIEGINKSATITAAGATKIKKALADVGQAGRTIAPLIGGVAGEFISLASTGASAVKGVAAALIGITTPIGAIATAATAAAAGIIYFTSKSERLAAQNLIASRTLEGMKGKLAELSEKAKAAATDLQQLQIEAENLTAKVSRDDGFGLVGRSQFQVDRDVGKSAEENKAAQAAALVTKELADQAVVAQRLTIVQDQLQASLKKLNFEYNATGDKAKYLEAQTTAYTKALNDAAEIEGVSADTLKDYSDSAKVSADSVEALRKEVDALARSQQAIDDQFNPGGSQFQGPLLKDAGPKPEKTADTETKTPEEAANAFIPENTASLLDKRLNEIYSNIKTGSEQIDAVLVSSAQVGVDAYNQLAQGIGDAIASSIIFQQDFGKAVQEVLANIVANIISSLIQIGIQQLLLAAISAVAAKSAAAAAGNEAAGRVAANAAIMFSSIAAGYTVATLGIGFKAALAKAAVGSALLIAGSAAAGAAGAAVGRGVTALAEGGLVTGPINALVGEAGPEVVIPLDQLAKYTDKPGAQTIVVQSILDGKVVAMNTLKYTPSILRQRGVKG